VILSNEVECDEAYVIAGHKGQPKVVESKGRKGRRRRRQGKCGRGTLEKERPPVFGMMQRGGQVVIKLLANVQQKTIEPFIKDTIVPGTLIYTDEYVRREAQGKNVEMTLDVQASNEPLELSTMSHLIV
jgi:ISXO2-like transposase domain